MKFLLAKRNGSRCSLLITVSGNTFIIIFFKNTNDSYTQLMQIKIVHRFFPTNALLHKMNIAPNNLCCFCNTSEESLLHVLYECEKVKTLVQYLESKIRDVDPQKHKLINKFNVLIGTFNNDDKFYTLSIFQKIYRFL